MSFKSQYFELNEPFTSNYNILDNTSCSNKPINNISISIKDKNMLNSGSSSNPINNPSPPNTFPLAWTCYKKNNRYFCPMRGDK